MKQNAKSLEQATKELQLTLENNILPIFKRVAVASRAAARDYGAATVKLQYNSEDTSKRGLDVNSTKTAGIPSGGSGK